MNKLTTERRAAVVAALVEGNSLRGTARLTGVARMTVEKLLRDLGTACAAYHDANVRGLKGQRIQCDEIWSFCYSKQTNTTFDIRQKHKDAGDVWTWTAIDADSKLCISWLVGGRDAFYADAFMQDVASRVDSERVQLTTDNYRPYFRAIEDAFGARADYATLEKHFRSQGGDATAARRYSPGKISGLSAAIMSGRPSRRYISTSYVERQNLTMRMHMRRFARLSNAFSKKIEMHAHTVALHFMYYNFCKIHQTLRVTPAMEAGLSDHAWETSDLIGLLTAQRPAA